MVEEKHRIVLWFLQFLLLASLIDGCIVKLFQFGYSTVDQPKWKQKFPRCGGAAQSPINIVENIVTEVDLPILEMVGYHSNIQGVSWIYNDGYSVRRKMARDSTEKPYVFTRNGSVYEFVEFHFHWGSRNSRGAEHIINSIHFPMEMHIVHRKKSTKSTKQAVHEKDGFLIMALFFQIRNVANRGISQFVENLHHVIKPNSSYWDQRPWTLESFMHGIDTETYYTYEGSFTTPPCYETVKWYLFPDPISITSKQLQEFRKLQSWEAPLQDNYRWIQKRSSYVVKYRLPATPIVAEAHAEKSRPQLEFLSSDEEHLIITRNQSDKNRKVFGYSEGAVYGNFDEEPDVSHRGGSLLDSLPEGRSSSNVPSRSKRETETETSTDLSFTDKLKERFKSPKTKLGKKIFGKIKGRKSKKEAGKKDEAKDDSEKKDDSAK